MSKINFLKYKIFMFCLIFFILGILVASFWYNYLLLRELFLFGIMVFLFFFSIVFKKNKNIVIFFLFMVFFVGGVWRYILSVPLASGDNIRDHIGENVEIEALISGYPVASLKSSQFKMSEISINGRAVLGDILVTDNRYKKLNYGDRVRFKCELQEPENFNGFAYDRYLAKDDIYTLCFYPDIEVLGHDHGNRFYGYIFKIKEKLQNIINKGLEEPEAGLLSAMILGEKRAINNDLRNIFSCVGLSHIIAISGMHISILSFLILAILIEMGFNRKHAFGLVLLFLCLYIVMIGAPASAVRAGIMGAMVGFAFLIGRIGKGMNILIFTAFILLMINPRLLRDDIGFQLSFLAIAGVLIFYDFFDDLLHKFKFFKYRVIRDILNMTFCAQILTWPLLIHYFGIFSVISIISNLLVVWSLPVIMILSILALFFVWIFPFLSVWMFLPVYVLLKYVVLIADILSKIPLSCVSLGVVNILYFLVYYFMLFIFYLKFIKNKRSLF